MENLHLIEVTYHGATNTQGARVKITSHRFKESIYISFDYALNNIYDMAEAYLNAKGFDIVAMGETKKGFAILSSTFDHIK
jgi:hypothetical protein